jgi:hypothetical protein
MPQSLKIDIEKLANAAEDDDDHHDNIGDRNVWMSFDSTESCVHDFNKPITISRP